MLNLRVLRIGDMEEIARIHHKFFKDEFELPDFLDKFHSAWVIDDNDKDIILAGGIRPISELVCVTNMEISTKKRVIALKEATRAGLFASAVNGYDQLHCFVQGNGWERQVKTFHFRPTKGTSLVADVDSLGQAG